MCHVLQNQLVIALGTFDGRLAEPQAKPSLSGNSLRKTNTPRHDPWDCHIGLHWGGASKVN